MDFPGDSDGEGSACNEEDLGSVPGWGNSLVKEMATHSTILFFFFFSHYNLFILNLSVTFEGKT